MDKPTMPRALKVEGATTTETLEHFMRLTDYYIDLNKWNIERYDSLAARNATLERVALMPGMKNILAADARIAELESQLESLQNRWATRPLSSEDQGRRIAELEADLNYARALMRENRLQAHLDRIAALEAALRDIAATPSCDTHCEFDGGGGHDGKPDIKTRALNTLAGSEVEPPAKSWKDRDGPHCPSCSCGAALEAPAKPKQFEPIGNGTICSNCTKTIGYHYQTAEGNLFCEVPHFEHHAGMVGKS